MLLQEPLPSGCCERKGRPGGKGLLASRGGLRSPQCQAPRPLKLRHPGSSLPGWGPQPGVLHPHTCGVSPAQGSVPSAGGGRVRMVPPPLGAKRELAGGG